METLIWVGFSMSLFAGSIISASRHRRIPQRVLSIWLFVFAADFLLRAIEIYTFGQTLTSNSFLLLNPLLYLYTRSLTAPSFKLRWNHLLHLAPFILLEILVLIYGRSISLEAFINRSAEKWIFILVIVVSMLSWFVYIRKSALLLFQHNQFLKNEFSTVDRKNSMAWLKSLTLFYVFYSLIMVVLGAYFMKIKQDSTILVYVISSVSLFMVYCFSYYGLLQEVVFLPVSDAVSSRTLKITLSETIIEEYKLAIFDYFKNEKPFLDAGFNMEIFAGKLNIPKHQLTYVLNQHLGKNFFTFVNDYRVEEVKRYLLRPDNKYSIEAIGYDCGFNSKSTFFTIFKKSTGMTPMQFRKANAGE